MATLGTQLGWSARRGTLLLLLGLAGTAPAAAQGVDPWVYVYAGLNHFYNLEYEESLADLGKAEEADPTNPVFHNFVTNVYLFQELYRLGQLEGNLYSASNTFLRQRPQPDPQRMQLVKQRIAQVKLLCQQRLAKKPHDTEALYALGIAYGIEANYLFSIERRYFDAVRRGGRANDLHERVLKLDPNYHDAKLIPGLFQYVVGSIPRSVKWVAFLFGYGGSKERGVRLMHEAMTKGKLVTSDAAILLTVIYGRENQHGYARQLLDSLGGYFPRNPLLFLETGRSFEREGNRAAALQVYRQAAERLEAGIPNYPKLPRERLYYQIGILHQQLAEFDLALEAYGRITERPEGDGLLKAYSGLRRGEIYLAQNQPARARAEYEHVAALPYDEPRREAQLRLRALEN